MRRRQGRTGQGRCLGVDPARRPLYKAAACLTDPSDQAQPVPPKRSPPMTYLPRGFAAALLASLLLLGTARAEMIDFTYSWTVLPSNVIPGNGTGAVLYSPPVPGSGAT